MSKENEVVRIECKPSVGMILIERAINEWIEEERKRKRKNIFFRLKKFFMKRFDF